MLLSYCCICRQRDSCENEKIKEVNAIVIDLRVAHKPSKIAYDAKKNKKKNEIKKTQWSEHFTWCARQTAQQSYKSAACIPRWREAPAKHTDLLNERHLHFFSWLKFAVDAFFSSVYVFRLFILLEQQITWVRWNRFCERHEKVSGMCVAEKIKSAQHMI